MFCTLTSSLLFRREWPKNQIESKIKKWNHFNDSLQSKGKVPVPFHLIPTLITNYLPKINSSQPILDVGCETGKNAIPLIQAGHSVVLLDIAPNAITYTKQNLRKLNLLHGVADAIIGPIETLPPQHGKFKAVIGTYALSFIPPALFNDVMKKNVLERIEPGGYFAGAFFGPQHAWAQNPHLSILTQEKLKQLFSASQFEICQMTERMEMAPTVFEGNNLLHSIEVIAKKSG